MEVVEDPAAPRRLLSRVPAEDEARAGLATEVFSAVVGLVQPQLDAYSAQVISPLSPVHLPIPPVHLPCISLYLDAYSAQREAEAAGRAAEEALAEAQRVEGEVRAAHEEARDHGRVERLPRHLIWGGVRVGVRGTVRVRVRVGVRLRGRGRGRGRLRLRLRLACTGTVNMKFSLLANCHSRCESMR